MKINNCKLCEIYDNQKHSGDKGAQSQYCRHTSAAAAAFLSPNHIRDFLAFHLLRVSEIKRRETKQIRSKTKGKEFHEVE
ncbi:CLUMA_CG010640, isoform A [Clunio marinus]|uniref:CLUMA_CG010640, isoform A n=1 Tax=Clunio marinus TaxID=568069 RepID=A0A1J1ICG6_9DIPT|nr:CLUMA_CG010640, isoform A [Clunio marinus]